MVQTINPAVYGERSKWAVGLAGFISSAVIGALASAIVVLAVVSFLNAAAPAVAVALVGGVILIAILRETGVSVVVPYRRRQVPEHWRHAGPAGVVGASYGFLLGTGFATPFVSAAHLAALTAVPFSGSTLTLVLVSLLFAFGRSSVFLSGIGVRDLAELNERFAAREAHGRGRRLARRTAGISAAALVLASLLLKAGGLG